MVGLKKLKLKKREKKKEEERKNKKEENSTELQKPNTEAEVYNNNKKCDWGKQKLKSLIRFHSANEGGAGGRGMGKKKKKKNNPKESTEQVKT